MQTLPERTDILIVGGGPTGLAAALSLHKEGCTDLIVVDDTLQEAHTSRAVTMHAATLEAVDGIDCAEDILAAGIRATSGKVWDGAAFHAVADFTALAGHTKFPCLCLVPQFATERVLAEKAAEKGIRVVRPAKAVGMKPNEENPELTDVVFEDGQVIRARYVVGADGAKSVVREAAGITYTDPDNDVDEESLLHQAIIADVTFETPPPIGSADFLFILSHENIWLCFPLLPAEYGGEQVWRIAIGVPIGVPPHAPDTAFLQGVVDAYGPGVIPSSALPATYKGPTKISKTIWSSRFRTNSAISSTHFTRLTTPTGGVGGVVVLVGDAAHKHPPAGGQGMNLGLRDAVFLGPVIAKHVKQASSPSSSISRDAADGSLRAWADVRHARALKVIRLTKTLLTGVRWKNEISWWYGVVPVNKVKLRQWLMWLGGITGFTPRMAAWQLSGLMNR